MDVAGIARKKRHKLLLEKLSAGGLTPAEIRELDEFEHAAGMGPAAGRPGVCTTQLELAKAFGKTTRTVQHWTQEGCPRNADGSYSLLDVQAWLQAHAASTGRPNAGAGSGDLADDVLENHGLAWWQARHTQLRAKMVEHELALARKHVVPVADVARTYARFLQAGMSRLLGLPKQISPALEGLDVREREELLSGRVREIAEAFAGGGKASERSVRGSSVRHEGHVRTGRPPARSSTKKTKKKGRQK